MPLLEAEFWVAVGFFLFVGVLVYFGIPRKMLAALDSRGARIKAELDDAKRLRDEAEALLAQYRRKRQEAEREADEIIAGARAEAERVAAEAKTRMEEFVARRSQVAEAKIAQAETQAIADVRAAAAEAAVAAAEKILTQSAKGEVADRLLTQGIRDVKAKLN
jgi:F-type H+-transporting ATPase subunit b